MTKYLYGASVQGIQEFIFKTNKLKEIVGASEIVEQICTEDFFHEAKIGKDDKNLILSAAGNIKYVFEEKDKANLENLVRNFPKFVMLKAPGILISQAVIQITDNNVAEAMTNLEIALKQQRNKVPMPIETGFMCIERARRTGGNGIKFQDNEVIDEATKSKHNAAESIKLFQKLLGGIKFKEDQDLAFDITDITKTGHNKWIAVVHADGNGLGNIIQNLGEILTKSDKFYDFSKAIEEATKAALQTAFVNIIEKDKIDFHLNEQNSNKKYRYPIRPIIIGGDDVTYIIRADLALQFTETYLKEFEINTRKNFKEIGDYEQLKNGLTACAGIAFVKESYPLHYALDLAEQLTKDAKKFVKSEDMPKKGELPFSSLSFHKVMDSFVEPLKEMKERTKIAKVGINEIKYDFGPYLIEKYENKASVLELNEKLMTLDKYKSDNSKGISKLRQLITESFKDISKMEFMKSRMKIVNAELYKELDLDNELKSDSGKSVLVDLIQIHTFNIK